MSFSSFHEIDPGRPKNADSPPLSLRKSLLFSFYLYTGGMTMPLNDASPACKAMIEFPSSARSLLVHLRNLHPMYPQ